MNSRNLATIIESLTSSSIGLSQLQRLDKIVAERNRQVQTYLELIKNLPVQLLDVPKDVSSSDHLAVIRLHQATAEQHRQVFEGMGAAGIGVQLHYSPVHLQPYYRSLGFVEGQFPEAEAYGSSAIVFPVSWLGWRSAASRRTLASLLSM